jgi:hypothetical protein
MINLIKLMLLAIVLTGCVTVSPRNKIVVKSTPTPLKALDVEFSQVFFTRVQMTTALLLLSNAITSSPDCHSHFAWYGPSIHPPIEKNAQKRYPMVSINESNICLRSVLDKLCAQIGWSYEEDPMGIYFSKSPSKIKSP